MYIIWCPNFVWVSLVLDVRARLQDNKCQRQHRVNAEMTLVIQLSLQTILTPEWVATGVITPF